MKSRLFFLSIFYLLCSFSCILNAQTYAPLDAADPVGFGGDHIYYQGKKVMLDEKNLFIDGQFSNKTVAENPFVYNSFNEAAKHFTEGTTVYIAPYVYWIDNPDDPEIRTPHGGDNAPIGLHVNCSNLKIIGLTDNPQNVVLACNRGQSLGSKGNFTMFSFKGDDLVFANLTMGDYCNVDLEFPLKPLLNRPKRSATIVQAQLAFVDGDRIEAHNCRFISRLNTCNLLGGRRTLFDRCHTECTDDALATGVYLNCTFGFYSSKPFGGTRGTGSVMLNCDFEIREGARQYFTKVQGQVAVVDSRYHSKIGNVYIGWNQNPTDDFRGYQYNVTFNGTPIKINADKPETTVDMAGKRILDAYRFEYQGKVYYNTYNLLRGDDDWDPMGIRDVVRAAEREKGVFLVNIPTQMLLQPAVSRAETSVSDAKMKAVFNRFGNYPDNVEREINYQPLGREKNFFRLDAKNDAVTVSGRNYDDDAKRLVLQADAAEGLQAAAAIDIFPRTKAAPLFLHYPKITENPQDKTLNADYELALDGRVDNSFITWYRCKESNGSDTVAVKVSRNGNPEKQYSLSQNDVGYYIAVKIQSKHASSFVGEEKFVVVEKPISAKQVKTQNISTDFHDFPVAQQKEILAGFWTLDVYIPVENQDYEWNKNRRNTANDGWFYGKGTDGAANVTGIMPYSKGSRLLFTPVHKKYGKMSVYLQANPCKTAAQGFGMAGQYLDVFIKFDTKTMSGYALRIIRTTKSARATDFLLVQYDDGKITPITEAVTATAFQTICKITIEADKDILRAHAETTAKEKADYPNVVDLQAKINPNIFGGTGLFFTSSGGANSTVFDNMEVEWK